MSNDYCISCVDLVGDANGGFIDADGEPPRPHAVAHMINHSKTRANVIACSFLWDELEHPARQMQHLNRLAVGSYWFIDPYTGEPKRVVEGCCPLKGIAFLSTRKIDEGEELFLDYNFERDKEPEWCSD